MKNKLVISILTSLIILTLSGALILFMQKNESKITIAKSLEYWKLGATKLAIKLVDKNCSKGDGNSCTLEALYLSKLRNKTKSNYKLISLVNKVSYLYNKACILKQPFACGMLYRYDMSLVDIDYYKSLFQSPLVYSMFRQKLINKCLNSGDNEQDCEMKVDNEIANINTYIAKMQYYEKHKDKYRKLFCKYAKSYNPGNVYFVSDIQKKVYDDYIEYLKNTVKDFRMRYCND